MRLLIIGGGVSGLAAAFRALQVLPSGSEIVVLERSGHWGGLLQSMWQDGFLLEAAADSFVQQKPEAGRLCSEVGLNSELIVSKSSERKPLVWKGGRLHDFSVSTFLNPPVDLLQLKSLGVLSEAAKQQLDLEPAAPCGTEEDESVADFFVRRFGREVLEVLIEPLMFGVYGGRASDLSLRCTLPALYHLERTRGFVSTPAGPEQFSEGATFVSLRQGMGELPARLVRMLRASRNVRLQLGPDGSVASLVRTGKSFEVGLSSGILKADAVIVATDAVAAARLLESVAQECSRLLEEIRYSTALIVSLAYNEAPKALQALESGFLVPPAEGMLLSACTNVGAKFPGRCPPGGALLRCFVGGDAARDWMEKPDSVLAETIQTELRTILGIEQEATFFKCFRWRRGLPQYSVGHAARVRQLEQLLAGLSGVALAGNFWDGVGVSDSIRRAKWAVDKLKSETF